ncbi:MAG: Ig-like domain-containing protein [Nocardioides sp.]|nr:Ig-like domain-containing protein [Nocardioides sp.]
MSALRSPSRGPRTLVALSAAVLLTGVLTSCNATTSSPEEKNADVKADDAVAQVSVSPNVGRGAQNVPITKVIKVNASDGTLTKVVATGTDGVKLTGSLNGDQTTWSAGQRLEPGTAYTLKTVAESADGSAQRSVVKFSTADLTLDEQTYASVAPLDGETVGVGMPVIVHFDVPVTDQKSIEKHMSVSSTPQQKGSWHWMSETEVRYRPASYWKPGTDVKVDVDVNSIPAGNGIYGQESRSVDFHVGDSVVSKVNAQTHQMKTYVNGKLARTMPTTTGKPGFTTRSGVKVIMEKFRTKRMNSETIGIDPDAAEGYDLDDVEYAMRVTNSGEFIHAAPWSTGSQGYANVSHGCTGLSTENAGWLYGVSKRGDVVEFTGTDRQMTLDNGYGDWNESFRAYAKGSALHR